MPSGILWGKECVLGAGCVIDPAVFIEELDDLEARGLSTEQVHLSGNAQLIMPWHVALDRASERPRQAPDRHHAARDRAGVRRQGGAARDPCPGPARPEDPAPEDRGRARGEEPLARAGLRCGARRPRGRLVALRELRATAPAVCRRHVTARRPRAARGPLSSSRAPRERCWTSTTARIRSSPRRTRWPARRRRESGSGRTGSTPSRRGEGVLDPRRRGAVPDRDRRRGSGAGPRAGGEYGITGRERRCGWLDLVGLRYAARLNGFYVTGRHQARRPLVVRRTRSASGTGYATDRDGGIPGPPERLPPREPVYEVCPAGRSRSTGWTTSRVSRGRPGSTWRSSSARSAWRSRSSAPGPRESTCSQRGLEAIARP